jgi:t-SNARE complex subunit (syntaxin)
MPEFMAEYEKLQSAIDDLGSAIDGTLGRQKEDLQRTHKTETRKVQVEIETLSKEKARLEESIATNERANQLETQRDW